MRQRLGTAPGVIPAAFMPLGFVPVGADGFTWNVLLPLVVLAVIVLLMRWTFSGGKSLVQRRPRAGNSDEYGLLVAVAHPRTLADGEAITRQLRAERMRVTLVTATDGPAVLVFAEDEDRARAILAGPPATTP